VEIGEEGWVGFGEGRRKRRKGCLAIMEGRTGLVWSGLAFRRGLAGGAAHGCTGRGEGCEKDVVRRGLSGWWERDGVTGRTVVHEQGPVGKTNTRRLLAVPLARSHYFGLFFFWLSF